MLSFTPDRIDVSSLSNERDVVWVLYRLNPQSCMIIGVFDTRESAFAYTRANGPVDEAGWAEPHPGKQHWQYNDDVFTYVLEQHQVRQGPAHVCDTTERPCSAD